MVFRAKLQNPLPLIPQTALPSCAPCILRGKNSFDVSAPQREEGCALKTGAFTLVLFLAVASMSACAADYPAPAVRNSGTKRELVMMRWGMPPPQHARACHQYLQHLVSALAGLAEA